MKIIHPSGLNNVEGFRREYKYVRFDDNTVLFCDACDWNASHQQIITDGGCKALPISAGKIQVEDGKWCVSDYGSITAKLEWKDGDDEALNRLLIDFGLEYDPSIRSSIRS